MSKKLSNSQFDEADSAYYDELADSVNEQKKKRIRNVTAKRKLNTWRMIVPEGVHSLRGVRQ